MIVYKDVIEKLYKAGYTLRHLREKKLLSQHTLTSIRNNRSITMDSLNTVCRLTHLPVEELIEYVELNDPPKMVHRSTKEQPLK